MTRRHPEVGRAAKRRLFFAPEVVQTSATDCGPASLKSLLEGFGIRAQYGRLREACQTDVDGTSIEVMEEVANRLGLDCEQTMLPVDHLLLPEADALPAIVVVQNPDGYVHFVVAWRKVGPFVQLMDPASGRRWTSGAEFLARTFSHRMPLPADVWRAWAGTELFLGALRSRLRGLEVSGHGGLIERAVGDPTWRSLAALDAATRMAQALVRAGAVRAGAEAGRLVAVAFEQARTAEGPGQSTLTIPPPYWSAGPLPDDEDGTPRVLLRGVVLVRVRGLADRATRGEGAGALPAELAAALHGPPERPLREIVRALRADGVFTPGLLALASLAAAFAALVEPLALRGLLGVAPHLGTWERRLAALAALVALFGLSLAAELPLLTLLLRLGRRLELRLRVAFLSKIPRLNDRYFASRPASDMSHRAHALPSLRALPQLGFALLRHSADLLLAALGLIWLAPGSWPYVVCAAGACLALPLLVQRPLAERDLRVRAFDGALTRFSLDALLGGVPIRTHGAGPALRREHETMLGEYRRAFLEHLGASCAVDAATALVGVFMTVGLLAHYFSRGGEPAGSLLLIYWALSLPAVGAQLASVLRRYPELRNTTERLLEPLGALEDEPSDADLGAPFAPPAGRAARLRFEGVEVRAAGQTILEDISLAIDEGSHVAIVGPSGAGKSSLVGLLLGWHRPALGHVLVDGQPLRAERLDALRRQTAWVDPAVQLWNRSLLANVEYGASDPAAALAPALEAADVIALLQRLPDGLQTRLGDGGALVSGGEGQRVRIARAMLRADSRLVLLDEPFRGLDREKRRELLGRARALWRGATLLCVTHDVEETRDFPRVLVVDQGRVVEDGAPAELAAAPSSRYRALLGAEANVREGLWRGPGWRRFELRGGVLAERRDEGQA